MKPGGTIPEVMIGFWSRTFINIGEGGSFVQIMVSVTTLTAPVLPEIEPGRGNYVCNRPS
jgi:hypothetical protein